MATVTYMLGDGYVGERHGPEIPEEGDRTKPYSENIWSRIETVSPGRMREIQEEKFRSLVSFAYEKSPFYRSKWDQAGATLRDIRGLDDIHKLPIIAREETEEDQELHPPFGTILTCKAGNTMKLFLTSGTVGQPRLISCTKETVENFMFGAGRAFYSFGVRPGWRCFYAFGFLPFQGFWGPFFGSEAIGCQNVPKGTLPTVPWLKLMQRLAGDAPSALCGTPTYALRQLEVARENGIDPHALGISKVVLSGEPGACVPATNRLISQGWNAQCHDIPGLTDVGGPVLYSCDYMMGHGDLSDHVNADQYFIELLDPVSLTPVSPDSRGVRSGISCITALSEYGRPAIRFLGGDYMTIIEGTTCGCGRTLPIAKGGVRARSEHMVVVKGVNIYPSLVEHCVRSIPGLSTEYELRKRLMGARIVVEAVRDYGQEKYPSLASALQKDIIDKTTVTMDIEVVPPGTLPRDELKSRRFVVEE